MQTTYELSSIPQISGAHVAILQVKWYKDITDGLVERCIESLRLADCPEPEIHIISGSLELPLAVQTLVRNADKAYDAVICVGAILKGETLHFEMIVDECIRGLGQVMLTEDVPVIVEVLPIFNLDQLRARCSDDENNKGLEAALATAETIAWRRGIKRTRVSQEESHDRADTSSLGNGNS